MSSQNQYWVSKDVFGWHFVAHSAQHILAYLTLCKFIIDCGDSKSFIHYNSSAAKLQVNFHQSCSERVQNRESSTCLGQDKINYRSKKKN